MPDHEEVYANKKIVIRYVQDFPQLWIDGKNIPLKRTADGKAFLTKASPFRSFGSVLELAKHLIDQGQA